MLAGWFQNRSRFGKVPKKIWEAVFGFGWDTASLEKHVMCSEVVKSPPSLTERFSVKAREGA